uniref:Cadherin domain-containing protein n=1 Tax=Angiostrongylus cantonensis TaxID=6313 RepID=A0A158PBM8_ANGCA
MISLKIDEDIVLSLDPPSESVAVSPLVVGPNSAFHLLLLNPQQVKNNGGEKLKLQALGLITGREQVVSIEVKPMTSTPTDSQKIPSFEKTEYDLILEQNFEEKEIAIIKDEPPFPFMTLRNKKNIKTVKVKADHIRIVGGPFQMNGNPPLGTVFKLIGPLAERFNITSDGQLVYVTTIQCEIVCITPKKFTLLLEAVDDNSQQFATLSFKAVGNERLKFLNTTYEAIVQEETGVFEKALKVIAVGGTGDIVYSVEDPTNLFSIHPKTGILMVQHPEFLTRSDYGTVLLMTAIATDMKTLVRAPIHVTLMPKYEKLNNFHFAMKNYSFTILAGQRIIGTVEIIGAENHTVLYDISEGGQGVITVNDNGTLIYYREPEKDSRDFRLLVTARSTENQFFLATTWVNVIVKGIHSNPIRVIGSRQRSTVLSSKSKSGSTVAEIQMTDHDNDAVVQLSLVDITGMFFNGSVTSLVTLKIFKVHMIGRKSVILLNNSLDDLPLVSMTLTLHARDMAHDNEPVVVVTQHFLITRKSPLVSETPLPFKFIKMPKAVRIPANSPVGSTVFRPLLLQSIISRSIDYLYDIDSPSNAFRIDNTTGVITTSRSVDDITQELLTITAIDPITERSTRVDLTVLISPANVRKLAFVQQQYTGNTRKSDMIGTTVATVEANSSLGDVVSYTLEGSDAVFFSITDRGTIILKRSIASVPRSELDFVARASDGTLSRTVPVRIMLEDEVNISFEKGFYDVRVMENVPINGYILYPKLLGVGNTAGVKFLIEPGNEATVVLELLQIDSDGRYVGTYEFLVRAILDGHDATTKVLLRILAAFTCVPRFLDDRNLEFTIAENSAIGTWIGTVSAIELDSKCELKYLLWDTITHQYTNETSIVSIDVKNGEIRSRAQFDYEEQAMHPVKILSFLLFPIFKDYFSFLL